jgi:tape measure domain-containing protein
MSQYTINFSSNASAVIKELNSVIASVAKVESAGRDVTLNLDTSRLSRGIAITFKDIDKQINAMQRKLSRLQIGSGAFRSTQAAIGFREGQRERGDLIGQSLRLRGQSQSFEEGSLARLSKQIQALQIDASQVKPNSQEWVNFQQQIGRIQGELKKADQAAEAIQLRGDYGIFSPGSLNSLSARLKLLKLEASGIAPSLPRWKEVNAEIQKTERSIEKINRKPLTTGQRAGAAGGAFLYGGGLGGGVGSALGGIAGGLAGGVPGAFAGAAIGQITDNLGTALAGITSQASKIQQLQRGLALASIDAKDFAESQAAVADTSARLFIPVEQVTKSFAQLRVNTKQYGLSVEETKQILEGTILAVSSVGGSAQDVDGAMRAVVQILSKGSVQAEELRGQLGERFPGAVVKFAQANKLSFEELQQGLEQGQIGIKEFVTFAKQNYEDYAAFSKTLSTAPEFAGRRLQVALEQISLEVGSLFGPMGAGIQDALTSAINGISDFVKENRVYIRQFISDFNSIVGPVAKIFVQLLGVVAKFSVEVGKVFQGLYSNIRQALGMANIGEAKARLDRAEAATKGMVEPKRNTPGGGPFRELEQARQAFRDLGGQAAFDKANAPAQPTNLTFGGPGAGMSLDRQSDEDKKKKNSLEAFERLRDQLADAYNKAEIERIKQRYEVEKRLRDDLFDIQDSGANRLQRQNLSFVRALIGAERSRMEAVMEARLKVEESMGKMAEGAATGISVPSSGSIDKKVLRDWLVSQGFGRTTGDFTNAGHATPNHTLNAMDMGILGGSDADALRKTIAMERKLKATGAFGSQLFGPERDPYGHGAGKGGQNIHLHIPTPGGKVPMTPGLANLMSAGGGAGLPRKVGSNESRDTMTGANVEIAKQALLLTERNSEILKGSELTKVQAQYIAEAFGLPDLELDNKLLKERNKLVAEGVNEDTINYRLRLIELDEQHSDLQKRLPSILKEIGVKEADRKRILDGLTLGLDAARVAEKAKNDETLRGVFAQEQTALNRRMTIAQALTPDQELRAQIGERFSGAEAEQLFQQTKAVQSMEKQKEQFQSIASSIGDSFGNAFKGIVTGSMSAREALAGFFQSVADSFADMVAKMIAEYLKMALIKGIMSLIPGLGAIAGGLGGGGQNLGASSSAVFGLNSADMNQYSSLMPMANGGVLSGGFQAFANGGIVTGPTLGLVGEGRYNEAVIPLPDGKSVPVDLGGAMGNQITSNIVVNVSSDGKTSSSGAGSDSAGLGRKIEGAVKQVIVGELRPGGLLAGRR